MMSGFSTDCHFNDFLPQYCSSPATTSPTSNCSFNDDYAAFSEAGSARRASDTSFYSSQSMSEYSSDMTHPATPTSIMPVAEDCHHPYGKGGYPPQFPEYYMNGQQDAQQLAICTKSSPFYQMDDSNNTFDMNDYEILPNMDLAIRIRLPEDKTIIPTQMEFCSSEPALRATGFAPKLNFSDDTRTIVPTEMFCLGSPDLNPSSHFPPPVKREDNFSLEYRAAMDEINGQYPAQNFNGLYTPVLSPVPSSPTPIFKRTTRPRKSKQHTVKVEAGYNAIGSHAQKAIIRYNGCEVAIPVTVPERKLYQCKIELDDGTRCPASFHRPEHRTRHEEKASIHSKVQIFECVVPRCRNGEKGPKRFSRMDNLRSHYRKTHIQKPVGQGRNVRLDDWEIEQYDLVHLLPKDDPLRLKVARKMAGETGLIPRASTSAKARSVRRRAKL